MMDLRMESFYFNLDLSIKLFLACAFAWEQDRNRERRRQRRRFWRHPIIELRESCGAYHTLYAELNANPEKFQEYTRMSQDSFRDLLARVQGAIRRQDTQLRRAIPPEERLLVTLRFLATGESLSSLHFQYRLGISTLFGIVEDTCRALWNVLRDEFIPLPTVDMWLEIAEKFWSVCDFPNCLGAGDGKHIRIIKPARTGSEYFNYKKYFSIVLMAIADANCRFIAVDIGTFGRGNDSQTFKNSDMGCLVYGKNFKYSPAQHLPNTQGPPMPFVMVGDEAFQMCENLLKPYSSRDLNHTRRIFNYRLTRARRTVECTFGILVAKWRILASAINLKVETVDEVVKACVVLHNYIMAKEQPNIELDEPVAHPLPDFQHHPL
ncbi:protein ILRUN isoform X1 [Ranitomeya variabilis]|uniref:protein ILRUN isoform X1 n=1 Tax=Ranitomeya variabilis TaxID=490064 RepID=UPI004057518F